LTAISPFNLAAPDGSPLLTGGFSLGWSIISSQYPLQHQPKRKQYLFSLVGAGQL